MRPLPDWWESVILALAVFRVSRFVGWDTFPPVVRVRAWLTGERPGAEGADPEYDRPLVADLIACPFCFGFWASLAAYGTWLAAPRVTLYVCFPLALSAAVGLIGKRLDP